MIIDSHVHFGKSVWGDFSPEILMDILGESVDVAICSNLEGIDSPNFKGELDANREMLEVSKRFNKIKPLLVCQPNIAENENVIKNLLVENPQVLGLKFHPECMKLPANSDKYDKYLQLARDFKKPCLFHSGHIKSRFSSPKLIYEKAKQFSDVPIILGHLSTGPKQSHIEAIEILLKSIEKGDATLYVDTSWIDFSFEKVDETMQDTLMLIEALKNTKKGDYTNRILWATDCPVGAFNQNKSSYLYNLEIFKQRVLERFEDVKLLEDLLSNNAKKLYNI